MNLIPRDEGGDQLHTHIDLRGNIPSFIHISVSKLHDENVLDELLHEPGPSDVMDRGYLDFERLYGWHEARAFFVNPVDQAPFAIKSFFGTSENAVKSQVWIDLSDYVTRNDRQETPGLGCLLV